MGLLHQNKRIFTIPNGFDAEEVFSSSSIIPQFTITYTGQLLEGRRSPELLFHALRDLIRERKVNAQQILVKFYGPKLNWLAHKIEEYELSLIVSQEGEVHRDEVRQKQRESQILLLLTWNDPREKGVYTGKIFEYLATRRPILAIGGPRGVVSELLETTQAGVHVADLENLKAVLMRFYNEHQERGIVPYHGKEEEINKYSHYEMAKKFAQFLDEVCVNHR